MLAIIVLITAVVGLCGVWNENRCTLGAVSFCKLRYQMFNTLISLISPKFWAHFDLKKVKGVEKRICPFWLCENLKNGKISENYCCP